jgi:uncharacterized heparinase superfamily protein
VATSLILEWILKNPPGRRTDAWDPFPISLRVVNWIKYLSLYEKPSHHSERIIDSIYQQCLWLEHSIEYHLMANHIFKNAKALIFSGLFLKGPDAERWLSKGLKLLNRELHEQILVDGAHFERSPMYHSMIFEDCLDLLNICQSCYERQYHRLTQRLRSVTRNMIRYLIGVIHPDGHISLFNDAALGIEVPYADLLAYYENVSGETAPAPNGDYMQFPNAGYFIICPSPLNKMIIDCGPIGPQYQTGHSHSDTLSFELSVKGRRVIVDSGCFGYEEGVIRNYNRGNAGHNSLTIDGKNQSEVWKSHRCARRAQPLYAKLGRESDGQLVFDGAHDGYRRLDGGPEHHRRISWSDNTYLIQDRVLGNGRHDVESRLHIHPSLLVDRSEKEVIIMDKHEILARIYSLQEDHIEKIDGWYCPEFGIKDRCAVLRTWDKNASLPSTGGWRIKVED